MNHVTHLCVLLKLAFFIGNQQVLLYQKIQILLKFFESLNIFLINMVTILMMSAKLVTPGFLKTKIFQNEDYDVIILHHDVTNKILSRDLKYIVDVVM